MQLDYDLMVICKVVIQLIIRQATGQTFGPPDFESEWLTVKAQDYTLSDVEVAHNLGQLPVMVDVLVKSESEPNKDFIFKAVGNGARDDDDLSSYGAVIYMYSNTSVRIIAPRQHTASGTAAGGTIYTGEAPFWRGVNTQANPHEGFLTQQCNISEASVKVKCWTEQSLPLTCYHASNFTLVAGSSAVDDTYLELEHHLNQRPDIVSVRAKLDYGQGDWYIDGQGSNPVWYGSPNTWQRTGGLVYGYNNETIRIWTSSVPPPGNVLFAKEDGWGRNPYGFLDASYKGVVEVRAWCSFNALEEKILPIGPGIPDENLAFQLSTFTIDHFITVKVQPRDGVNHGYLFDGIGGAMINTWNLGTPCSYGGVVYGLNKTILRVWRPDHSTGAALCIGSDMGHGINSQASNNVDLVVTVWTWTNDASITVAATSLSSLGIPTSTSASTTGGYLTNAWSTSVSATATNVQTTTLLTTQSDVQTTTLPTTQSSVLTTTLPTTQSNVQTTTLPTTPSDDYVTNVQINERVHEVREGHKCTHFHRLAVDVRPSTSLKHISISHQTPDVLDCHKSCYFNNLCLAFVWHQTVCVLYNSTSFPSLITTHGSEIWTIA